MKQETNSLQKKSNYKIIALDLQKTRPGKRNIFLTLSYVCNSTLIEWNS